MVAINEVVLTTGRVLVTGSRYWPYQLPITFTLRFLEITWPPEKGPLTLIEGHCPTGADMFARSYVKAYPDLWTLESYPASWKIHGRAAGMLRNQEMVDSGADLCVAFVMPNSRGTLDCIKRATKAGIPVYRLDRG